MSSQVNSVIAGVLVTVISASSLGLFKVYSDVEVMKKRIDQIDQSMASNAEATRRFTEMMNQMDKSIAVQSEIVATLKEAVNSLEVKTQSYNKYDYEPIRRGIGK